MTVQTGGSASSASTGGTVKAVRQEGTRLNLDFEEGGTLEIQTVEPTASVMVRDQDHTVEYADGHSVPASPRRSFGHPARLWLGDSAAGDG
jgi:hypothetical protein